MHAIHMCFGAIYASLIVRCGPVAGGKCGGRAVPLGEGTMRILERTQLDALFNVLRERGFTVIAPTLADGAIVWDEAQSAEDLPAGWTDVHEPGSYRLERLDVPALFGYAAGPRSLKHYLNPPRQRICTVSGDGLEFAVEAEPAVPPKYAFIGVRGCELAAVEILDLVYGSGPEPDPRYTAARNEAFVVAVHCTAPSAACFCRSMDTGPRAAGGYDLALTELCGGGRHVFVVEAGSEQGTAVLDELPTEPAGDAIVEEARAAVDAAAHGMERRVDLDGIHGLLTSAAEDPHWDDAARRCLGCANCTLVCPTCFCATVEDVSALDGQTAERWRVWDSCFTMDFTHVHGGSIRKSGAARYRHWLTHKFATWLDQFGRLGCVGCGRCITWCPVGIDVTAELAVLREHRPVRSKSKAGKAR